VTVGGYQTPACEDFYTWEQSELGRILNDRDNSDSDLDLFASWPGG